METIKSFSSQTLRDFSQVDLALAGNQLAYKALFNRYWKQLLFAVYKMIPDKELARDLTMEAFSKAFGNLHQFKKAYGFSTWLYRIAINHSIDYMRKKRLTTTPLSYFASGDPCYYFPAGIDQDWQNKNAEEQIIQLQTFCDIERCLQDLSLPYREVAMLRFLEKYSYQEIASSLNLPLGTVKTRIHRARYLLQKSLLSIQVR